MSTHFKTIVFAIGLLLGVTIGELFLYASEVAMFSLILGLVQSCIYIWEIKNKRKRNMTSDVVDIARHFSFALTVTLFFFGVFLGVVRVQLVQEKSNVICPSSCSFEAQIISQPETKNDFQVFNVRPNIHESETYDVQVRTTLYPKYQIGERLTLSGKVTEPKILYSHNDKKYFDYPSYLHTKNVGSEMYYPKVEALEGSTNSLAVKLGRIKNNMVNKINLYVSQPASSLASGMLFGDSSFSEEMKQIFRVAGLSHIIVLSGFNIAIIISFVLFLMSFLPFFIRVVFASIGVIFFVIMVGAEASVIRATLMAFIALLATSLGRQYVAKQALMLSLLAIVLYEPESLLHNVSLHLSFIATAGIIYLSEPIHFFISRYVKKKFLQEIFTSTLSAYGMTLPYLMYIFGSVSLYAIVANVVVLFFVPIGMLLTFVVVVVSYFSSFGALLFGLLTTVLMDYIIMCAKVVSSLPYASISINVSLSTMILLYLFLYFVFVFTKWKEKDETLRTEKDVLLSGVIRY